MYTIFGLLDRVDKDTTIFRYVGKSVPVDYTAQKPRRRVGF